MNSPTGISALMKLFSHRNYAIYTLGNSVSLTGLWVQRLAVGWLAWELTESGFWLGAVAFADLFPVFLVAPFAGVIADRYDRRWIAIFCQIFALVQASILFCLVAFQWIDIVILFTLTLIQGFVVALNQPARLSLVHSLVPAQWMASAVAINSVTFNLARFIGPAIAGVLISAYGVALAFAVNALSYFAMIVAFLLLRLPPQVKSSRKKGVFVDAMEGIRYAVVHPVVVQIMLLMLAMSFFCRPVFELLPGFADEVFGRGAAGLAIFTSAVGFGAVGGGVWIAQRGRSEGLLPIAMASCAVAGLVLAVFASVEHFWIAVLSMVVAGFTMVSCGVSTQTLIQNSVEEQMRGRALSLWGMIFRGGPALGALVMGWFSGFFGLGWPVGVGGGLSIIAVLFMWIGGGSSLSRKKSS